MGNYILVAGTVYLVQFVRSVGRIAGIAGAAGGSQMLDESGNPDAADRAHTSTVSIHLFTAVLIATIVVFLARPMWHMRRLRQLQAEANAAALRSRS